MKHSTFPAGGSGRLGNFDHSNAGAAPTLSGVTRAYASSVQAAVRGDVSITKRRRRQG